MQPLASGEGVEDKSHPIRPKAITTEDGPLVGVCGAGIYEGREGFKMKVGSIPYTPTDADVDLHNATHIPFRGWAKHVSEVRLTLQVTIT